MKLKSKLIAIIAVTLVCSFVSQTAQARRNGTLPEDNSSTQIEDNGGISNSGSGKQGGGNKVISQVKVRLVAAPEFKGAQGSAKIRVRTSDQEFEVEAKVGKKLAGTVLSVTVDDAVVGTMTVNSLGRAKLALSSEAGQIVPVIQADSIVGVITDTGAIVLAGQF